jgi:tRNA dimethylallyltransferase
MQFLTIGLERPRQELYQRIEERVDAMFNAGLLGEVASLLARGFGAGDPGMRGIGYRELLGMRRGCDTIAGIRLQIAQATRRYAKRQITFFRSVPGVCWMSPDNPEAIRARIDAFVGESKRAST